MKYCCTAETSEVPKCTPHVQVTINWSDWRPFIEVTAFSTSRRMSKDTLFHHNMKTWKNKKNCVWYVEISPAVPRILPTEVAFHHLPQWQWVGSLAGALGQGGLAASPSLQSRGPCERSGPGFRRWCSKTAWHWDRCLGQKPSHGGRTCHLQHSTIYIIKRASLFVKLKKIQR